MTQWPTWVSSRCSWRTRSTEVQPQSDSLKPQQWDDGNDGLKATTQNPGMDMECTRPRQQSLGNVPRRDGHDTGCPWLQQDSGGAKQLPSMNRKSMHDSVQGRDERELEVGKEVERDLCHRSLSGKGELMFQDSNPCFCALCLCGPAKGKNTNLPLYWICFFSFNLCVLLLFLQANH